LERTTRPLICPLGDDEIADVPRKRRGSTAIGLPPIFIDRAGSPPPLVFSTVPLYFHR